MSIFGKIKDAIFGKKAEAATPPAAPATTASPAAPQPVPTAPAAVSEVDVEAILTAQNAYATQPPNWRTSIVDLMKLLDIDSSLANRKELAQELGYTGALDGSAEKIGRAHVCTTVTNAHLVCRLLLEQKKNKKV